MMFRRTRREMPGLNTTSTADISFMLLIFFLVTTSMDVDRGLPRQLPPAERTAPAVTTVERGRLMEVAITAADSVTVDGRAVRPAEVGAALTSLLARAGATHLVTIDADPASHYDTYFAVQDALVSAYAAWRGETARRLYHRPYAALTQAQRDRVRELCPQRVAEKYRGQAAAAQTMGEASMDNPSAAGANSSAPAAVKGGRR